MSLKRFTWTILLLATIASMILAGCAPATEEPAAPPPEATEAPPPIEAPTTCSGANGGSHPRLPHGPHHQTESESHVVRRCASHR